MFLKKINDFITTYMPLLVLGIGGLALFFPKTSLWIQTSWINYLLMLVMFGMGLTLKPADFLTVLQHPKDILIGSITQFTIMPLLAFILGKFFGLETALLAGVVLVGACPGGTASNVMTFLGRGDIAFSVGMTSINTLLAPLLTPVITYLFLHTHVTIDIFNMFLSILKVVIFPIGLGFLATRFFPKHVQKMIGVLPLMSIGAIALIIATVVSHQAQQIFKTGFIVLAVVILHNLLGYLMGFLIATLFKMKPQKIKAFSLEIGMQNSGLATSLATTTFPSFPLVAVPGAVFSVWHNISGALLAHAFRKWGKP